VRSHLPSPQIRIRLHRIQTAQSFTVLEEKEKRNKPQIPIRIIAARVKVKDRIPLPIKTQTKNKSKNDISRDFLKLNLINDFCISLVLGR